MNNWNFVGAKHFSPLLLGRTAYVLIIHRNILNVTHEVLMNTDKIDEFVNNFHELIINKLMDHLW